MPRPSAASRRLADAHHGNQLRVLARVEQASGSAARAVGGVWQKLLAILRDRRGYDADFLRAYRALVGLSGAVTGSLTDGLAAVYSTAHRAAAASVGAAPRPVREDATDPDYLALLIGPPDEALLGRLLGPLVQPADWLAIGDSDRRLPQELAALLASGLATGQTQREIALALRPHLDGSRVRAARAARTFGMVVAHGAQMDAWGQLGSLVVGYTVHATRSACPPSRTWHQARDGTTYYASPGPGQKGYAQMPRPPFEADDPAERPPGTPRLAFNCKCYNTPVLSV